MLGAARAKLAMALSVKNVQSFKMTVSRHLNDPGCQDSNPASVMEVHRCKLMYASVSAPNSAICLIDMSVRFLQYEREMWEMPVDKADGVDGVDGIDWLSKFIEGDGSIASGEGCRGVENKA